MIDQLMWRGNDQRLDVRRAVDMSIESEIMVELGEINKQDKPFPD